MRIALYHPWVYLKSGLERTIFEIAERSRHEVVIFTNHYDRQGTYPQLARFDVRQVNPVSVKRDYGSVLSAARRIATTKLDLSGFDALIICCDGLGSLLTIRNSHLPVINLCFTPLRAVYDLEYRRRHLLKHQRIGGIAVMIEWAYKKLDRWLWTRYAKVICISQTVRRRVATAALSADDAIAVCYPGIDERSLSYSDTRKPYFFLPGRIMWTKNVELGISAFLRFKQKHQNSFELIIAGMVDRKSQPYYDQLLQLAACPAVKFVLEPSDLEMQKLYQNCYAVVFTAFNEDLGLTPMEAMAKGKPVIAVNRGGPTEVIEHQSTGLLVDADPASFADAMAMLVAAPATAEAYGRNGLKRVEQFTWKYFVESFDEIVAGEIGRAQ